MDKHIQLIGILWIVYGGFTVLAGIVGFFLLFGISMFPDVQTGAPIILRGVALAVFVFVAIMTIPMIVGGFALLRMKEWGRILVLVLAFLSLFNFPMGTALGVYSLIILLNQDAIRLFDTPPPESISAKKPTTKRKSAKTK